MCELPECYQERFRLARKTHKCCECRLPIQPGETYQYASGIWDGSPDSYKTCLPCATLRSDVSKRIRELKEDALAFSGLEEFILEADIPEFTARWKEVKHRLIPLTFSKSSR